MPELKAISGIRFTGQKDISTKIAPPYDVLDEGPKQQLLSQDEHNIVAIDLPVTPPKTLGPDAAYQQAGELYRQWIEAGVLGQDDQPAIYAYEQHFRVNEQPQVRRGLFAALEVEEFNRRGGGIFRHEHTIRGGTDDRLKLMEETSAQLSAIFAVYDDKQDTVGHALTSIYDAPPTVIGTTAWDGVEHRLWVVNEPRIIEKIASHMRQTDVYIADGHHRYTTALNYHRANPQNPLASTCLFLLVGMQDPGLAVLPTHRVLCGLEGFSIDALSKVLEQDGRFELTATEHGSEQLDALEESLPAAGHHAVGLFDAASGRSFTICSKDIDPLATELPEQPQVWRELDVAVFHELLVDRLIRPAFGGASITYKYPHALDQMVSLCNEQPDRAGFVLQATPLESVCAVSQADGVMPPKSTFFYPKVATGLVINPLCELNAEVGCNGG